MKLFGFGLLFITLLGFGKPCDETSLQKLAEKAKFVVVATVESVEESPGIASSQLKVVQRVNYKVDRVLKGEMKTDKINVGHTLVIGSFSTLEDKIKGVRLSEDVFFEGNKIVLFLAADSGKGYVQRQTQMPYLKLLSLSENCFPDASDDVIAKVTAFTELPR